MTCIHERPHCLPHLSGEKNVEYWTCCAEQAVVKFAWAHVRKSRQDQCADACDAWSAEGSTRNVLADQHRRIGQVTANDIPLAGSPDVHDGTVVRGTRWLTVVGVHEFISNEQHLSRDHASKPFSWRDERVFL